MSRLESDTNMAVPSWLLAAVAAAAVVGAAAGAPGVTYVTPEYAEPRFAALAHVEDLGAGAGGEQEGAGGEDADAGEGAAPVADEHPGDGTPETRAHDSAMVQAVTAEQNERLRQQAMEGAGAGGMASPYTYHNTMPAYRSTYYMYPWMHEPFGPKPASASRFPIGAHYVFPWQAEERERYAAEQAAEHARLEALRSGDPHHHGWLPHPLPFNAGGRPWMTSWPSASPDASFPYYPGPHPEMSHQFGYYGAASPAPALPYAGQEDLI